MTGLAIAGVAIILTAWAGSLFVIMQIAKANG